MLLPPPDEPDKLIPVACEVLKLAKRGARSGCQLSHVERLDWVLDDMEKKRCQ